MTKKEIFKSYVVNKLHENTVFIRNNYFDFAYTIADSVVKDKFKGKHRYFGGLQCNYNNESPEFKNLENWLIEIAERTLNIKAK